MLSSILGRKFGSAAEYCPVEVEVRRAGVDLAQVVSLDVTPPT